MKKIAIVFMLSMPLISTTFASAIINVPLFSKSQDILVYVNDEHPDDESPIINENLVLVNDEHPDYIDGELI
ncbi:hypothetical protein CV093_04915 [Oceanobacillus sp. 143]|uniref:Uncharacterized protein n=1 Tax=Oceanobacillus zhaokaii TaxID=2052660 RepID=A0A345PE40_9BACI|nr:hypothetical protein [Oceanobacillus zhaokaii]AXI08270.1 hypothetical protein CUC15_04670 [Oceanobacillus zhaokaii]QGS68194.1 hypothetical protein CV093_04915 [Oceanobacillus sp. 143]